MKNLFLLFITLTLGNNLMIAQTKNVSEMSEYNLYIETGTNIVVSSASINIEKHFNTSASEKIHWYGRVGIGGAAVFYGPAGFGGLGGITMLTGRKKHHFELSGGIFLGTDEGTGMGDGLFALPLLDVGYRFQKPEKSFIFRVKVGTLGFGLGLGHAF